eukprot:2337702-Rhodomonas_salina.1
MKGYGELVSFWLRDTEDVRDTAYLVFGAVRDTAHLLGEIRRIRRLGAEDTAYGVAGRGMRAEVGADRGPGAMLLLYAATSLLYAATSLLLYGCMLLLYASSGTACYRATVC